VHVCTRARVRLGASAPRERRRLAVEESLWPEPTRGVGGGGLGVVTM
jgi:hypothetical protein